MNPKLNSKKRHGQVVIVETIYYQPPDDQPKAVENGYLQRIESEEQPYGPRRLEVGEAWVALDLGWITSASVLAIKNEEGRFTQTIPTEAQLRESEGKVLELGILGGTSVVPVSLIPARQSIRLVPVDLKNYRIRCQRGAAKYSITLFPK